MKYFDWDEQKNAKLKEEREVCFEDVLACIGTESVLGTIDNSNQLKYPDQQVLVVQIRDYVYAVPFVETETKYFFKTIYPSRKLTKQYLLK